MVLEVSNDIAFLQKCASFAQFLYFEFNAFRVLILFGFSAKFSSTVSLFNAFDAQHPTFSWSSHCFHPPTFSFSRQPIRLGCLQLNWALLLFLFSFSFLSLRGKKLFAKKWLVETQQAVHCRTMTGLVGPPPWPEAPFKIEVFFCPWFTPTPFKKNISSSALPRGTCLRTHYRKIETKKKPTPVRIWTHDHEASTIPVHRDPKEKVSKFLSYQLY